MASQPNREELLVAMQESVCEIRDSLLALRDAIREEEQKVTKPPLKLPDPSFQRETTMAPPPPEFRPVLPLPDDEQELDSALWNSVLTLPAELHHPTDQVALASFTSDTVERRALVESFVEHVPPLTQQVQLAHQQIKATHSPAQQRSIITTAGGNVSTTGTNELLRAAELSFAQSLAVSPPPKPPDANPTLPPLPKPPDLSLERADSTMPPPPPAPPDQTFTPWDYLLHKSPSHTNPSPSDPQQPRNVIFGPFHEKQSRDQPISFCTFPAGSFPSTQSHSPPLDLQRIFEASSQPLPTSTIRMKHSQPITASHMSPPLLRNSSEERFIPSNPQETKRQLFSNPELPVDHAAPSDANQERDKLSNCFDTFPTGYLTLPKMHPPSSDRQCLYEAKSQPFTNSTIHLKRLKPITTGHLLASQSRTPRKMAHFPSGANSLFPFNAPCTSLLAVTIPHVLPHVLPIITRVANCSCTRLPPLTVQIESQLFLLCAFHDPFTVTNAQQSQNCIGCTSVSQSDAVAFHYFGPWPMGIFFHSSLFTAQLPDPHRSTRNCNEIDITTTLKELFPVAFLWNFLFTYEYLVEGNSGKAKTTLIQKARELHVLIFLGTKKGQQWDPGGLLDMTIADKSFQFKQWDPGIQVTNFFYNLEDKVGLDGIGNVRNNIMSSFGLNEAVGPAQNDGKPIIH